MAGCERLGLQTCGLRVEKDWNTYFHYPISDCCTMHSKLCGHLPIRPKFVIISHQYRTELKHTGFVHWLVIASWHFFGALVPVPPRLYGEVYHTPTMEVGLFIQSLTSLANFIDWLYCSHKYFSKCCRAAQQFCNTKNAEAHKCANFSCWSLTNGQALKHPSTS